jgi:hypothetical protein
MTISKPRYLQFEEKWTKLRSQFLHFTREDSIWAFSFNDESLLPDQGWKLHISATIRNACSIFKIVAPILSEGQWHYKAPSSLNELKKLNSGLFYGYSQIGKFITVYLRSNDDFLDLVNKLKPITTKFKGPSIPSDKIVPTSSCLFYRYGCFKSNSLNDNAKNIISPDGKIVPDRRERKYAIPDWLNDPLISPIIPENLHNNYVNRRHRFFERYRPYRAISQRGKGGVYLALDFSSTPLRVCILKEGRKGGELDWSWRDGFERIQQEAFILREIENLNVNAPRLIDSINYHNHAYIVIEHINGISLDKILNLTRKIPIDDVLHIAYNLACFIYELHNVKITWRDIKPMNVIIDSYGNIHLIDFEGAVKGDSKIIDPWGSPGYVPHEWLNINDSYGRIKQDLFAFGATLHHMITGELPKSPLPKIGILRKRVPHSIKQLIAQLTSDDRECRLDTIQIIDVLSKWKNSKISNSTIKIVKQAIIKNNIHLGH